MRKYIGLILAAVILTSFSTVNDIKLLGLRGQVRILIVKRSIFVISQKDSIRIVDHTKSMFDQNGGFNLFCRLDKDGRIESYLGYRKNKEGSLFRGYEFDAKGTHLSTIKYRFINDTTLLVKGFSNSRVRGEILFNKNGIYERSSINPTKGKQRTRLIYNEEGRQIGKTEFDAKNLITSQATYNYLEFDSLNNWTKRLEILKSDTTVTKYLEERTIEYY